MYIESNPFYMFIKCKRCSHDFHTTPSQVKRGKKYCSRKCADGNRISVNCKQCSKEFTTTASRLKYGRAKYCSRLCWQLHKKGEERPDEQGELSPHWNGGRRMEGGYVLIYQPHHPRASKRKKCVREHILVAEQALGRFLTPDEQIHHIDNNKINNVLSNLYLFASNSKHVSFHQNVRWGNITLDSLESNLC